MTPNIEPHEIGYLLLGGAGFLLTLGILVLRIGDLIHRYKSGVNGEYRALAWERLITCATLLFVNGYMVTVALFALNAPPREWTDAYRITIFAYYGTGVMVLLGALFQWWLRLAPKRKKK